MDEGDKEMVPMGIGIVGINEEAMLRVEVNWIIWSIWQILFKLRKIFRTFFKSKINFP